MPVEAPLPAVIHATVSLSRNGTSAHASLYCEGGSSEIEDDLAATFQLPPDEQLDDYRVAVLLSAQDAGRRDQRLRQMRDLVGAAIPAAFLSRIERRRHGLGAPATLAIELQLNDPGLERYPWELLAAHEGIAQSEITAGLWRRVFPAASRPKVHTPLVFLVGSSPFSVASPFTHQEIRLLADRFTAALGIIPRADPAASFADLRHKLKQQRPEVLHLVAHGRTSGLVFQSRSATPSRDRVVPYQELTSLLKVSPSCSLVYLNVCDSATCDADDHCAARLLATEADVTAIGMAGEVSPEASLEFAEKFYGLVCRGASLVDAFATTVGQLIRPAALVPWSMPVMYAADATATPFPSSPATRTHRAFQELNFQLNTLLREVTDEAALDRRPAPEPGFDPYEASFRVAMMRDILADVAGEGVRAIPDMVTSFQVEQSAAEVEDLLARIEQQVERISEEDPPVLGARASARLRDELAAAIEHTNRINTALGQLGRA